MGFKDVKSEYSYTDQGLKESNKGTSYAATTGLKGYDCYGSYNKAPEPVDKIKAIESIIKALGTMVEVPEYVSNPNQIGAKLYNGVIRQPILMDSKRDEVTNKLVELIKNI